MIATAPPPVDAPTPTPVEDECFTVLVTVTPEDVVKGCRSVGNRCPVARAVARVVPEDYVVGVGTVNVALQIGDPMLGLWPTYIARLHWDVSNWIISYDANPWITPDPPPPFELTFEPLGK